MRGNDFLDKMELVRLDYVEAADKKPKTKGRHRLKWGLLAASLCALIFGCVFLAQNGDLFPAGDDIDPEKYQLSSESKNVSVRQADTLPDMGASRNALEYLTEDEIFTWGNTTIVRGKVTAIKNIEIDFNGVKDYCAIATVNVEKVFRGNCKEGSTIEILLPTPIGSYIFVEDTGIISQIKVGMEGIFMPLEYDEDSFVGRNGSILKLTDLVPYGLPDGMRFVFLMTHRGLLFENESTYQSIANAETLEEIELYIEVMLDKTS